MILKLSVNNQSVESSGITKDYKDALCEYVWNSFEANATAVAIDCIPNELTGSAEIVITDNGDGIAYDSLERTFGAFLASQKNSRSLQIKTKANKGKGRFSCFSFASLAEWSTVTATPDGNIAYTISLENADKNQCDVSDPAPTTRSTGTRLIISGIDGICEDDVSFAQLEDTMLKAFAWYLYLNKDKKIVLTINGTELDYRKYINTDASVEKEILISRIPFKIALIVWNEKITENFSVYFLDEEGVVRSKDTTTFNRNTVNFNHSVFVTSPFFLGRDGITLKGKRVELDGQTALNEYDEDKKVLKELSKEIQKLILQKYADENGFQNTRFYVDDGYSGANFNRPAFEQMMDDMSNGDIAVIITKDLSRLGRNQLHTGLYIEEIFPSNDVRYIAVNDNVDTKYENSNELMPFKNLFNEWHVRDCSRKVRNVVNAKAQRGIRVGTRAPYGYRKGATKDSPLLVDEEAAAVVKRIFAMCAGGMGPAQIAKQLKKECIYSPSMYAYTKFGTSHSGLNAERPYNWTGDMVADMLQNMVYLGHTVNLRYSTKSYKDKKRCERPKSEWLIFENTHEELVDQETWDIVQEVRSHKRRRTNMDEQNMFSGLVYCADCGKPMVLHRAHTMKPEQNHFTCRTYKKDGAEVCSAHYIREVALKEIVLETIRRATEFARSDPERFAAYIQQKQSTEVAKEIRGLERELSTMRKRDGELDVVFKRMYEDSALGRVSNEQFRLLSEAYSKEKAQLAEAIPATEERLEKLRSSMANAKNFIAKARKFTDMTELTPELLRTFVAKIIVYEKEVKYSKHAPQKIHICFRDFNLNETDDMLLCGETTEKADGTIALPA